MMVPSVPEDATDITKLSGTIAFPGPEMDEAFGISMDTLVDPVSFSIGARDVSLFRLTSSTCSVGAMASRLPRSLGGLLSCLQGRAR